MLTVLFNLTQLTCTNKITSIREEIKYQWMPGKVPGTIIESKQDATAILATIFLTAIKVH